MENGNAAQESQKEGWNCKADQRLFIALQRILLDCITPLSRYLIKNSALSRKHCILSITHALGKGSSFNIKNDFWQNTFPEHFCQFRIVSFTSFFSLLETS